MGKGCTVEEKSCTVVEVCTETETELKNNKSKIFRLCSGGRKTLHRDRDEETILCVIPVKTTRPRCYLTFIGSTLFLSTENYFTERNQYVVSCHQKSTNKEYRQVVNFSSNPELTDVRQEAVALKIEQSNRPGGDTC